MMIDVEDIVAVLVVVAIIVTIVLGITGVIALEFMALIISCVSFLYTIISYYFF